MNKIALYCSKDYSIYNIDLYNRSLDIIALLKELYARHSTEDLDIELVSNNQINLNLEEYSSIFAWCKSIDKPSCENSDNDSNYGGLGQDYYLSVLDKTSNYKKYIYIDYINKIIAGKKSFSFSYQDALPKAMGLHKIKDQNISVLDGTAGLTIDSFALLQLNININITLIENSPVVYLLINDALERLAKFNKDLYNRVKLYNNDFIEYLADKSNSDLILDPRSKSEMTKPSDLEVANITKAHTDLANQYFDIIYLDPMFEKKESIKSKPKKNMQFLQDICFNPNSVEELLVAALKHAKNRVVIKRAKIQSQIFPDRINYSVQTKQIRYDVYLAN